MKTRIKITVTLAVGIGLLAGSMGVASASPHYTDWGGSSGFKAPVTSVEEAKVTYTDSGRVPYFKDSGRTLGFSHHANIDYFHQGKTSFEAGQVRPLFKIQF